MGMKDLQPDSCIMGVDIEPVSSPLSKKPRYSIVILCNNHVDSKYENAGLERIIRLAWEYKISILAIDNPFELARDARDLLRIAKLLPEKTEIVQVNLIEGVSHDFRDLLRKMGYNVGKITPSKTAYYLALLAKYGVGTSIIVKEARTKIVIRKKRSSGPGGMSSNRYKRKVRTAVLQLTNNIKKTLDENKLDYEVLYRKTSGGLEGAVFTVYDSNEHVKRIVKEKHGTSVSVEIHPQYTLRLGMKSERRNNKPLIVGIDPGLNTGIAILDVNGIPLYVSTKRQADRAEIINIIRVHGKPVIIATDVNPIPDNVRKIASKFGASIYSPHINLSAEEKHGLSVTITSRYGFKIHDSHSRDALAAAFNAYRNLSDKLLQVDRYISSTGMDVSTDNIKKMVITGKSVAEAIEEEIKRVLGSRETGFKIKSKRVMDERALRLMEEIGLLKKEKELLMNRIHAFERKVNNYQKEMEKRRRLSKYFDNENYSEMIFDDMKRRVTQLSRQLSIKNKRIDELSDKIRFLEEAFKKIASGAYITVPVIKSLTISNLNTVKKMPSHRLVFIENPDAYQSQAIDIIVKISVKGILVKNLSSDSGVFSVLFKKGIPGVPVNNYNHFFIDKVLIIDSEVQQEVNALREELAKQLEDEERRRIYHELIQYKKEHLDRIRKALSRKSLS